MHSYSLTDSPSSAKLNQQISYSQVTKQYLERQNDKLIDALNQLIEESNPKQKYGKIVANRTKQLNELRETNSKLSERNKDLQYKLQKAQSDLKRFYNILSGREDGAKMEIQSPLSSKSNNSSSSDLLASPSDLRAVSPQYQLMALQGIQKMHQQAQQLHNFQKQAIHKCMILLQTAFEKLNRMIEFEKISPKIIKKEGYDSFYERKQTIIVERQKYQRLIDYYVQSVVVVQQNKQNQGQVQQFSIDGNRADSLFSISQLLTKAGDLQKLFSQIAQQHNLRSQWEKYLTTRKQEAENFKLQIEQIYKGDKKDQLKINKEIDLLNKTMNTYLENSQQQNDSLSKTTLDILKSTQNEIEDILFKKLIKLVDRLQFTQKQKQLFKRFDQKRKCGRFFDIQQFLQKFKNRQDITEISEQYSLLMIKVMNSVMLKAMEILCEQHNAASNNVLDQTPLKWLKTKLDNKFFSIKTRLFEVIEKQSSQFLSEKHKNLNLSNQEKIKNRKLVQPLPNPKFDHNKQLQKELVKIVYEYKQVLESCVMNTNKKILVRIM